MTPLPKLSAPARRALAGVNVWNLEHLSQHTEAEIAGLHGMGPSGVAQLRSALAEARLTFRIPPAGPGRP